MDTDTMLNNISIVSFESDKLNNIVDIVLNYCSKSLLFIINTKINKTNYVNILSKLNDIIYISNYYEALINFMSINNKNNKWQYIKTKLTKFFNNMYTNKILYKQIKELNKVIKEHIKENKDNITFIKYILKKFRNTSKKIINVKKNINILEQEILKNTPDLYKKLTSLIILKNEYAKLLKKTTYFNIYVKDINYNKIKELLDDLIEKTNDKTEKDLINVKMYFKKDKILLQDIINYKNISYANTEKIFTPKYVINIIFNIFKLYFGLNVVKFTNIQKLWGDNILTYNIYDNVNTLLGILHIDLIKNENKTIKKPVCIVLSNRYVHKIHNIINPAQIILSCVYPNATDKSMSFNDVILLFKEFGNVIKYICCKSISHPNNTNTNIMPRIMEYIALDNDTINILCNNNEKIINNILETKNILQGITVRIKCINALFNLMIHNSDELITLMKTDTNLLNNLYDKLFKSIMKKYENIIDTNIKLDYNVILNEINNDEIILYQSILSDILAYSLYKIIKNSNKTKFVDKVLKNNNKQLDFLIHKFISFHKYDSYNIYLKDIMEYTGNITTILSDQPNNFFDLDTNNATKSITDMENIFN